MIRYENQCCDCAVPGYPCLGDSCPRLNVPVHYCDSCNDDVHAAYEMDGEHYCENHAQEYLKDCFNNLSIDEQAEILKIKIKELEG